MNYIGIDAHSRTCFFAVLGKNGKVLKTMRVNTCEKEILAFIRSVKGYKKVAFEEGAISQWLYVLLKDEVNELTVCQLSGQKGAKTDRIDAIEIADLLRINRLKVVFHNDSEFINLRAVISGYDDLVQELVRTKNRYKALFRQVAIIEDGCSFYKSPETIGQLRTDSQAYVAIKLFEQMELLERQKSEFMELFESNARKYKSIKLLTSIPGIGAVRANQLVAIVVTPYRFPTKYKFFAYAMLTKHLRRSDGNTYGKRLASNQRTLKGIFKSAIKDALRSENSFQRKYDEMIKKGSDHRCAQNAACKMLAAIVLGVMKSGKKYNDKQWEVTRRRNKTCHSVQ